MKRCFIPGPSGQLEAEFIPHSPYFATVIIAHPHPQYGGDMNNPVVIALSQLFQRLGFSTLRFNVRGVGKSDGDCPTDGIPGSEDLLAVIHWTRQTQPNTHLWLAGYSYGAYISYRSACLLEQQNKPVEQLLLIAPPHPHLDFSNEILSQTPAVIAQAENDAIATSSAVTRWAKSLPSPPPILVIKQADHFFQQGINSLTEQLQQWVGQQHQN